MPATIMSHPLSLPIRLSVEHLKELNQLLSPSGPLSFEYTVDACMYDCASLKQFLNETHAQHIMKLTKDHQLTIKSPSLGITIRLGYAPSVTLTTPTNERIGIYTRVIDLLSKNSFSWLTLPRYFFALAFLLGLILSLLFTSLDISFLHPELPTRPYHFHFSLIIIPLLLLLWLVRAASISVFVNDNQPTTFWDKISIEKILYAAIGGAATEAVRIAYDYFTK